ncbi:unnamed protein product [Bursaphelenchus xylophilus]|uniref:(pine wood nematode) hypothetical protein n=1 Tax=Bursaphelenchus xylophilus TaxID=6326 RepID=A0A1I7SB35_BURXY|nr:unnamed protein product [Bursaphelenchus xylophilus]CAG9131717.1 unnamed protein product [Bursaphelenchus xylophilus]
MLINKHYLSSNHGMCKILHIITGFIISSLLCANWYGGRSCFSEKYVAIPAGINMTLVFVNILVFILNFIDLGNRPLEKYYSMLCIVLYFTGMGILIWYMIQFNNQRGWLAASVVLFILNTFLAFFDVKILQGDIDDD